MKFRMVDSITLYEPRRRICGIKAVSFEEYQLKSVFADRPCLPESLILEALFQLGNWLIMLSSDFSQMGLVIGLEQAEFLRPLTPGHKMLMEIRVRHYRDDGMLFDGQAHVGRQIIARGSGCLAAPVDLGTYCDPDDLRVLFSEIYRPLNDTGG